MTAKPRKPAGITILGKPPAPQPEPAPTLATTPAPAKNVEPTARFGLALSMEAGAALKTLAAQISVDLRRTVTVQELLRASVDLLFIRHGKPPIAGAPTDLVE